MNDDDLELERIRTPVVKKGMRAAASNRPRRSAKCSYTFKDRRNLHKPSAILLGAAVAWSACAHAAAEPDTSAANEVPSLQTPPEAPDIPPPVKSGETLEPEVTIRREEKRTVTEYRVGGRLHSIKVEPVVGPAYWLVDTTGNGFTDTRYDNYYPPFAIPGWVIFRW